MGTNQDEPSFLVTTVGQSPQSERRDRERRYLITMGFRVAALIVAIIFAHGWILVVSITLAMVLPWVGVVSANAVAPLRHGDNPTLYVPPERRSVH